MNHPPISQSIPLFFLIGVAILLIIGFVRLMKRYLRVGAEAGYPVAVGTIIATIAGGYYGVQQADQRGEELGVRDFGLAALLLAGIPLVSKLYLAWIGGNLSEQEKAPGAAGIRAWLGPVNLILAVIVSISAAVGFGYPLLGILALTVAALLAYPVLMTVSQPEPSPVRSEPGENLTSEREKVLALLEAGKITAEESAELLNALGTTVRAPERQQTPLPPSQRTTLIGAAMVLIGFFLPWFSINLGQEVQRLAGDVQQQISQAVPGMPQIMPGLVSQWSSNTGSIEVAGGDIKHGLGWIILLASIGTAVLPLVAQHLDAQTQRLVTLIVQGAGTLLLVYLLGSSPRWINIGIVLAAAGYAVQWAALLKPRGAVTLAEGLRQHA